MPERVAGHAATVAFEHVTKHYDQREQKRGAPGRRERPVARGAGREDLRPRGPVGLRQDDVAQDGEPAHRADARGGSSSTERTPPRATSPSCAAGSATSSSRWASSPTRRSPRTWRPCPACSAGARPRRRERAEELLALVGLDPATYAARYPGPALRGRAAARRGRPGPRRRPADHAHGRALRGRRPDRPGAPPGRVPAPPGVARQDDPLRHPRHRRGHQDGRPRRRPRRRRRPRPVRAAGRDPGQPGLAVRRPLRRERPRPQAPEPEPGRRPGAHAPRDGARRRRSRRTSTVGRLADAFPWLLLVDELDRPVAWIARDEIRPGAPLARRTEHAGRSPPRPARHLEGRALDPPRRRRSRRASW